MSSETERSGPSFGARILAVIILGVAAWILLHFVIHLVSAFFSLIVVVAAVIAVIWAWRTLT
jgi:hypothetical protein